MLEAKEVVSKYLTELRGSYTVKATQAQQSELDHRKDLQVSQSVSDTSNERRPAGPATDRDIINHHSKLHIPAFSPHSAAADSCVVLLMPCLALMQRLAREFDVSIDRSNDSIRLRGLVLEVRHPPPSPHPASPSARLHPPLPPDPSSLTPYGMYVCMYGSCRLTAPRAA